MLMSMSRSYLLVLVSVLAGTASQEALAQHHGGRSSGFSHGASGFSHGSSSFSHHGYTGHTHSGYGHSYSSYRPSYPGFYGPSISLSIGRGFPLGLSYGSAYSGIGIGAYSSAYGYPYYGSSYRSYSPVTRLSVSSYPVTSLRYYQTPVYVTPGSSAPNYSVSGYQASYAPYATAQSSTHVVPPSTNVVPQVAQPTNAAANATLAPDTQLRPGMVLPDGATVISVQPVGTSYSL